MSSPRWLGEVAQCGAYRSVISRSANASRTVIGPAVILLLERTVESVQDGLDFAFPIHVQGRPIRCRRASSGNRTPPLLEGIPCPTGVCETVSLRARSRRMTPSSQWHGADELGQPAVKRYRPLTACSSQALRALAMVRV